MELLISEVQKRPVLWNKSHKKYRDRIHSEKKTKMNSKYIIFKCNFIIVHLIIGITIK